MLVYLTAVTIVLRTVLTQTTSDIPSHPCDLPDHYQAVVLGLDQLKMKYVSFMVGDEGNSKCTQKNKHNQISNLIVIWRFQPFCPYCNSLSCTVQA